MSVIQRLAYRVSDCVRNFLTDVKYIHSRFEKSEGYEVMSLREIGHLRRLVAVLPSFP